MSAEANAAFLYRTFATTEARFLSGVEPKDGRIITAPTTIEWAQPAIALSYGGKAALDDMLAAACDVAGASGGRFPALIIPAEESVCEEAREFAIVYDFVMQRRRGAVLTKPPKLKPVSGVTVQEGAQPMLIAEAAPALAAQNYATAGGWQGAVDIGMLEMHTANLGSKPAGMSFAVRAGLEYRLTALFTLPEHRGKGVGRALASHFISRAAQAACPLTTAVYPGSATFEFYVTKLGFTPALAYEVHIPPPGFTPPK
jgi:GNAT superfamily N-acetyltransferase